MAITCSRLGNVLPYLELLHEAEVATSPPAQTDQAARSPLIDALLYQVQQDGHLIGRNGAALRLMQVLLPA